MAGSFLIGVALSSNSHEFWVGTPSSSPHVKKLLVDEGDFVNIEFLRLYHLQNLCAYARAANLVVRCDV